MYLRIKNKFDKIIILCERIRSIKSTTRAVQSENSRKSEIVMVANQRSYYENLLIPEQ